MVSTFYAPTIGGVEKVIEELATRYVQQGHHVDIFCSDSDKHQRLQKKVEIIDGVHVHRSRYWLKLSLNTYIFPGVIWDLLWQKYDVVHSHVSAHDYMLFSGIIAFLKGKPHVHTTHCPWTDKFRPLSVRIPLFFTDRIFNYLSYYFCDKIIAITPWEVPIIEKWAEKKKIVAIPNGMDPILFKEVKKGTFKKSLGIKNHMVLFFGRLHPTKAPHILAEVAKEIIPERDDVDFVFVGPDEGEMQRVKDIAVGEKKIHVTGPLFGKEKIAQMYQDAAMYVLPSYREGLPLTLFEAMASSLPIIATPVNGVPYEIEDNVNGFLVPYGDKAALKKKIVQLLDAPKLAKKFGETNKKKAQGYTWDTIAQETMRVYTSLLEKKNAYNK